MARPGTFRPGQSGNPSGRPKALKHVEEAAREHTPAAIATLAAIMQDDAQPAAARTHAAQILLDRGWGKARQPAELSGPEGKALPALYTLVISG